LVKIIYIVAKKQVGYISEAIFKQAFSPSTMLFDFDWSEFVEIYSGFVHPGKSNQNQ
jgi:hypothetical protein